MTHTPGPWKVTHDEYAGHYDVHTFDREHGSEAIAQVFYANSTPGGRGEADANLIAAAPALLEALAVIENASEDDRIYDLRAIASAAIAAAKGAA